MANNSGVRPDKVYFPNIEVENLEEYNIGGYHPTVIGDIFNEGRGGMRLSTSSVLAATRQFGWLETDICNAMSH